MILKEESSFKHDFFSIENFIKLNDKIFLWLENCELLVILLNIKPFCNSSKEAINFVFFHNTDYFLQNKETNNLFKKLKEYPFEPFVISIIFSYLKTKYVQRKGVLTYYEWAKIVPILVNSKQSFIVLKFLIKLSILDYLTKTKSMHAWKKTHACMEKKLVSASIFTLLLYLKIFIRI